MQKIKVAIIEDEKEIRESTLSLIKNSEGFECELTFSNAEDAIRELPSHKVHVVLTDINLPGKSGIECISILKPLCPDSGFLVCTAFEDSDNVFRALKAGAIGYLVKTIQPSKLLDAITEAYNGGSPMSSHIARKVVLSFNDTEKNSELQKLSNREKEILAHLSKGLRYKEIADLLFLSNETIRTHIRNIYDKLQVNSRTEAINKAYGK
ncbi:MAG: DNA-binding response regulator [Bacteroidetes bacterium]|jgi:DNA-binding NarL/FixJ family response regulator|nr:DNA-binding response regulator [Bacteroidota bacterium]